MLNRLGMSGGVGLGLKRGKSLSENDKYASHKKPRFLRLIVEPVRF